MAGPQNLAVFLTHCGQLIVIKTSKIDATRCQILRLKCTKFDFPDPAGKACNASPALSVFKGPTFLREGRVKKKREREKEGEWKEGVGPAPQIFGLEPRLISANAVEKMSV